MKKILILIFLTGIIFPVKLYSQSCCGGSFYDIAVLSLDKKALFNIGYNYETFQGNWDSKGKWNNISYTSYQIRPLLASAYRFNKNFQAGVSIPFVFNRNELPGLASPNGSSVGDISVSGRYEIFHEYQRSVINQRSQTDSKTPYLALTTGLIFPTGKSDESATTEADITGKGYFTASLGLSALKSIVQNKFQIAFDFNYQHNFSKTYTKYYNVEQLPYKMKLGDRFNYALSLNYLVNVRHALSVSFSGFRQGAYTINELEGSNSNEHGISFMGSYTYYPMPVFRVTPSFKWFLPNDNFAKNTTGSYLLAVNLVYYLEY